MNRNIHPDDRAYIYERDEKKCLVCNESRLDYLTIDHIVPLSRGGRNHVSNYQTLCRKCNNKKGSEYIDYRWHEEPPLEISPTTFKIPKIAPKKVGKRKLQLDTSNHLPSGIHPLVELACENVKRKEANGGYSGPVVHYKYVDIHRAVTMDRPIGQWYKYREYQTI